MSEVVAQNSSDVSFMQRALELADCAAAEGEVPVGAVVVLDGEIIGEGWNQPIGRHDPTAHAEVMALRAAANSLQNYRLPGATLYVTIEPCTMCLGAMIHARISRLVFGAPEPKSGALISNTGFLEKGFFNHSLDVCPGVLEETCAKKMSEFFHFRREEKKRIKREKREEEHQSISSTQKKSGVKIHSAFKCSTSDIEDA